MKTAARSVPALSEDRLAVLRRAIDPRVVQSVLERHWRPAHPFSGRLAGCAVYRLFPRGADRFVVKYLLTLVSDNGERREQLAFGEIAPGDARARCADKLLRLRKSRRGQIPKGVRHSPALTAIPELDMVLVLPGYDEKLPGLALHHQPERAAALLARLAPQETAVLDVCSEILNHRPGKRCILRLRSADGFSVVARVLKPVDDRHHQNVHVMEALRRAGLDDESPDGVRVPRPLGVDDGLSVVVLEDVPGCTLHDDRALPPLRKAAIAATAIGRLHGLAPPVSRHYVLTEELAMLQEWVELTRCLRSDIGRPLDRALAAVTRRLTALPPAPPSLTHRDFYDKQVIHDGERTVLIDFDTLSLADPAMDLGNHIAHRRLAALRGEPWDADEDAAFIQGYSMHRTPPDPLRIDAWRDATLLRLACLYALRSDFADKVPELLAGIAD